MNLQSALAPSRPPTTAELFNLALAHHQAGDLSTAETLYQQILSADPVNFDATHLLGVAALQGGRLAHAEALITAALAISPDDAAAH
nr:tetratricopeptide repeat protein [Methylotetracoccus sp.]